MVEGTVDLNCHESMVQEGHKVMQALLLYSKLSMIVNDL